MSDNKVNYEVVDTTLQLIYEYNLDGGKREELVQSVIRMASNPHVSVTMKILCLWEIGNDVEMFRFMQEKFKVPSSALDIAEDEKGEWWSLLYRACGKNWRDMVEELVWNQGMSVNMQCSGFTPLMMAAAGDDERQLCSIDAARVLLNHPDIDLELRDIMFERTALLSVDRDHTNSIEMVKLLIKNGANWAAQDENGRDILGYVLWDDEPLCSENFKNLVKYLVKDVGLPVPVTMPHQCSGPTAPGWA